MMDQKFQLLNWKRLPTFSQNYAQSNHAAMDIVTKPNAYICEYVQSVVT